VTFFEKLQDHKGGLIRINPVMNLRLDRVNADLLLGKVGIICDVKQAFLVGPSYAWVSLFINGKVEEAFLHKNEVEFLQGPQ